MIRRRFVASVVAGLAGLFGAKAARGSEKTKELVIKVVRPRYAARLRLSTGKKTRLIRLGNGGRPSPGIEANFAKCLPEVDEVIGFSVRSFDHAVELAEAARLRYVVGSAMKATS